MASRQEEKEARRGERLEREEAEARASARLRRVSLVGGGLIGVLVLAAVVVALAGVIGGNDDETEAQSPGAAALAKLPAQQTSDLDEAVKAAGCDVENAKYEGADHEERDFTPADYKTNPPTSGTHFPDWYQDGVFTPGTTPNLGMLVHTLEHGRINVQYAKGSPGADVAKLEALLAEQNDGYHMLLHENATDMPYAVAATAWTQKLGCKEMNDKVFDALRAFRARYVDKGPETVP